MSNLPPSGDGGKKVTHNDTNSPATATLTFDLTDPDGRRMHRNALQGEACRLAVWEFDNWLRNQIKYSDHAQCWIDAFEQVRRDLDRILDDHGIRLDEE